MEIVKLSNKQNFVRLKKKKFHGNQFTKAKKQNVVSVQHEVASSSGRKLVGKKYQCNDTNKSINNNENYLCIVNFWNLKNLVSLLKCPECNSTITLTDNLTSRKGFCHLFKISCTCCDWNESSYTSVKCSTTDKSQGKTVFEANLCAVVAFREIGKGFSGMEKFTKCMNMFSMTNKKGYLDIENQKEQLGYEAGGF